MASIMELLKDRTWQTISKTAKMRIFVTFGTTCNITTSKASQKECKLPGQGRPSSLFVLINNNDIQLISFSTNKYLLHNSVAKKEGSS